MADPMLFGRVDFPEGQSSAQRYEDRVVAEAAVAAGRPGEPAFDLAAVHLGVAVRPGQRKHRDKSGAAVLAAEFPMNPLHRLPEVLGRAGTAGGVDPGSTPERRDDEAGIVGQRRQPARLRRARAFSAALASKLSPVSSGSGTPSEPAAMVSTA